MITPTQVATLIAYLRDLQAITVSASIVGSWCKYLNSANGAPEASWDDWQTAADNVAHWWGTQDGYREKLSPARLVAEVKQIRRERLNAWEQKNGALTPPSELADNPKAEQAWLTKMRNAIQDGQPPKMGLERAKTRATTQLATNALKPRQNAA